MTADPSLWSDALARLMRREELPADVVEQVMTTILQGDATDAQIAGFAIALRAKGETVDELAALVRTMLRHAAPIDVPADGPPLVDTCGTGGDRSGSVNISTMAALVVAGAGARVAKHGNRGQSSPTGSADVLEALGVVIDLGPDGVLRCLDEAGIAFLLAPVFHPAMRFAGPARKELGVPTTFNFLGPLANPARPAHQAVGVPDPTMVSRMAGALGVLGSQRALVFTGGDGLDELTTRAPSTVHELIDGEVRTWVIDPAELGFPPAGPDDLDGGDATRNAEVVRKVLGGEHGPVRDVVLLNAAAALMAAGLAPDLADGVSLAAASIDDGAAAGALDRLVATSNAARAAEGA